MKKIIITTLILAAAGLLVLLAVWQLNTSDTTSNPSITDQGGDSKLLVSALRTEPDFVNDTRDSAAIMRGTVVKISTDPEQVLNHTKKITLSIDTPVKGLEGQRSVEVYTFADSESLIIEEHEKIALEVGDSGVFFLDWMPQADGFYTLFGGPRGALLERDGYVRDWNGETVDINSFLERIQEVLRTPDTRPSPETLGDQIDEL
tara:strand:+ start:95 stop:706 length:612 start_codon:yes stop_codon:yes gene_type:complete